MINNIEIEYMILWASSVSKHENRSQISRISAFPISEFVDRGLYRHHKPFYRDLNHEIYNMSFYIHAFYLILFLYIFRTDRSITERTPETK